MVCIPWGYKMAATVPGITFIYDNVQKRKEEFLSLSLTLYRKEETFHRHPEQMFLHGSLDRTISYIHKQTTTREMGPP